MRKLLPLTLLCALGLALSGCNKAPKGGEPAKDGKDKAQAEAPFGVTQLAAGYRNSYALMSDGTVRAWGQNQDGQLGDGNHTITSLATPAIDAATPVAAKGVKDVVALEAGHGATGAAGSTACVIVKDGKVFCWGSDDLIPLKSARDTATPVEIAALHGAKKITMGLGHACALMKDATVTCWGGNYSGELGNGTGKSSDIPTAVPGLKDVIDVTAGASHVCAVLKSGAVKCWGGNSDRQCTPANSNDQKTPVEVAGVSGAVAVGMSDETTCALGKDAKLTCWGEGEEAVNVLATDVVAVDGADDHICIVKKDKTVHCWGDNDQGQLGQGAPRKPYNAKNPLAVPGLKGVTAVAVGYEHTCALTDAGVSCWGLNRFGELGDGTLMDRAAPVAVKGIMEKTLPPVDHGFSAQLEGKKAQEFKDLPKGCTYAEKLDMKHKAMIKDTFAVKSAWAERDSKGVVTIELADYNMREDRTTFRPRGDQLKAVIYYLKIKDPKAKKEERLPSDVGEYGISTDTERYTGAMSSIYNSHSGFELRTGVKPESKATLTYIGDDWICGALDVTNKYGHMKGTFAAKVKK